jgi:acyl dehydratase
MLRSTLAAMSLDAIALGSRHGPFVDTLDPERIRQYAAATNDPNPECRAGTLVPPTFPVLLVFEAQYAGNAVVPRDAFDTARAVVHGEHDVLIHRPLVPGEELTTWSIPWSVRVTPAGTRVVLRMEQLDSEDNLAAEQYWTTFFAGQALGDDAGPEPPDHTMPDGARARPIGSRVTHVDADQAQRYGEVSNDWSAHHFDKAVARAEGFPTVFLHGLCTMAMCSQAAVDTAASGDPTRVRRVAVRFSSPTYLDEDLTVDLFQVDPTTVAFEARCAGATVIKHGRAELRDA